MTAKSVQSTLAINTKGGNPVSHAIEFIETSFLPNKSNLSPHKKNLGYYKMNLSHGQIKAISSKEQVGFVKLGWQLVIKEKVQVYELFIS